MLKSLRRRMTLLFVLLTVPVLTAALVGGAWLYRQQRRQAVDALFGQTVQSLCDALAEASSVSDTWLLRQQQGAGVVLDLWDNGQPTLFSARTRQNPATAALLDLARQTAAEMALSSAETAGVLTFTFADAAGASWRGAAAVLPRDGGNRLELVLVQPTGSVFGAGAGLFFVLLWLGGTAALGAAGWLLAGRMLVPVRRAWQQQNEFIAAAGHELRSPLAVIKASLDAAGQDSTRQGEFLRTARRETDRMAVLTDDLLVLAAGDAGALTVRPVPTAPDTLCIEVYERFYPLAREQGHPLTLTLPDGPVPPLVTDAGRLSQLLSILLQNALDHTPSATPVSLTLEVLPGRRVGMRFSVVDRGPGIPDDRKEKIFHRFYRGDESRTCKQNFGLGLSVARELARLLRARLTLTDTPGGGATFTVELESKSS